MARLAREPIRIETWPIGKKYKGVAMDDLPNDFLEWAVLNIDSLEEKSSAYDPDLAEAVWSQMISRGYDALPGQE